MSEIDELGYDPSEKGQTFLRKRRKRNIRYEEVDFKKIKELAEDGYTERQIALEIDVSQASISAWKRRHPEFKALLQIWKQDADRQVERSLFERATGYMHDEEKIFVSKDGEVTRVAVEKHYPPDVTACIFWLKNRMREEWRDKQEVQHTGAGDFAAAILSARKRISADEGAEAVQRKIDALIS